MQDTIAFICTNDMHCAVEASASHLGLAGVCGIADELRGRYGTDNVCLVDSGDALGVGALGCVSDGLIPLQLMNACGYAVACPGNADLTFGADRLVELAALASFPYVCCNLHDATTGELLFSPYMLRNIGGVKVGFVGVITPLAHTAVEAANFAHKDGAANLACCQKDDGTELYAAVQGAVDAARADGAQVVVLLSHLGQLGEQAAFRSDAVVSNTHGIDFVADGHSHEHYVQRVLNDNGECVCIVQGGLSLAAANVVLLDTAALSVEIHPVYAGDVKLDDHMSRYIDDLLTPVRSVLGKTVCSLPCDLVAKDLDGSWLIRKGETNLGDAIADALCAAFDADLAFVPSWAVREGLPAGRVTLRDVYAALPLGHRLACVEVSGAAIVSALVLGASRYPQAHRYWLQVSSSVSFAIGNSGSVVNNICINGKPLDPDATYKLAGIDFMVAGGGSGFPIFADSLVVSEENISIVDAFSGYLSLLDSAAILRRYKDPEGAGRVKTT